MKTLVAKLHSDLVEEINRQYLGNLHAIALIGGTMTGHDMRPGWAGIFITLRLPGGDSTTAFK